MLSIWTNKRYERFFTFFYEISILKHNSWDCLYNCLWLFFMFTLIFANKMRWRFNKLHTHAFVSQIINKSLLVLFYHQNGYSWSIDSSGSTNSMDVVVWVFGRVNLYYIVNSIEIDSSWNNISGHQASIFTLRKILYNFSSTIIFKFAMNSVNQIGCFGVISFEKLA